MSEAFHKANSLFIDENFDEALLAYDNAVNLEPSNAEILLKRSICHFKLENWTDSLADANTAIKINPSDARGYFRKGLACFQMEEYEAAKSAFEKAASIEPSNAQISIWIRKCTAEINEDITELKPDTKIPKIEPKALPKVAQKDDDMPSLLPPEPSPIMKAMSEKKEEQTPAPSQPVPMEVTKTEPAVVAPQPQKTKPNIRTDWYQTNSHVCVNYFIRDLKKDQVKVTFEPEEITLSFPLGDTSDYLINLETGGSITPSECSYTVSSTKIEVKLKKANEGLKWNSLENTGQKATPTVVAPAPAQPTKPVAPKKKDWNKIITEEVKEEDEGGDPLNKLFQQIYANGSDEQKRAMMKSYSESNGTVLSTNWDEVGKGTVKGSAPDGMEMKKWEK